jgi:hypothetical protein
MTSVLVALSIVLMVELYPAASKFSPHIPTCSSGSRMARSTPLTSIADARHLTSKPGLSFSVSFSFQRVWEGVLQKILIYPLTGSETCGWSRKSYYGAVVFQTLRADVTCACARLSTILPPAEENTEPCSRLDPCASTSSSILWIQLNYSLRTKVSPSPASRSPVERSLSSIQVVLFSTISNLQGLYVYST